MEYASLISSTLGINSRQVAATISLLQAQATIPFIARYRKEQTGSLDEVQIAAIANEYHRYLELDDRKATILKTIEEQGQLTDQLRQRITQCWDSTELEDIYLPYKPHRKTKADAAREKGLEPLATTIFEQKLSLEKILQNYKSLIQDSKDDALQGARDIIAEWINQDEKARNAIRREFNYTAILSTKAIKEKAESEDAQKYRDYFAVKEPIKRISSHRLLAIRRAETEGFIRVDISPDKEKALDKLARLFLKNNSETAYQVELAMEDSYKRLLKPAIETEIANAAKEKADAEAIHVFARNLRQLLLESPLGQKRVLALDPGYRTGCKTVILSPQGDLLFHTVVFVNNVASTKTLQELIKAYNIQAIAIGNGTASRECEQMVRYALTDANNRPEIYIVNESGASVYSASKIAREEFPDEDVTVRGAVSIGRRLMDPLAELVKIDPKAIGVGQYQHDVNQTLLANSLHQTVESVVNHVGVDVNTASKHLLTYISGLGPTLAQNIINYRQANGPFPNRKALLKVPKMGAKTFEQAAGFLRVTNSDMPLDNSAVHPESYTIVERMARDLKCTVVQLMSDPQLRAQINLQQYITPQVGMPTLQDIMRELEKPTRDPRQQLQEWHFDERIHSIDDLQVGMALPAVVTNVTNFGAFCDMGAHKDGLIHISTLPKGRELAVHERITVQVLDIDHQRARINLKLLQQ